jgi:intracellular sulfur oxidation DsrE/DsrF family protein
MKKRCLMVIMALSLIGFFAVPSVYGANFDNSRSIGGLKRAQVYFDVSLKDDKLLVLRMELVDRTVKQMEEAGLEVIGVVGFRGGASRFITQSDHYVLEEEVSNKRKIQDWVKRFSSKGIAIEQCAIAAEILDIPTKDFLPEVTVVGNAYISLVGYQAKGYSVVPMD